MFRSPAQRRFSTAFSNLGTFVFLSFSFVSASALATTLTKRPTETITPAMHSSADHHSAAKTAYATLPVGFVPNAGQMDARVRYAAQSGGGSFYFTNREAVFAFASKGEGLVLRLGFLGANSEPAIASQDVRSGTVNYLIGNDPERWHTNLPTYGEIVYRDLWPGIDMLFRGESGQLTYEFLVQPGARVRDIRLAYRGAKKLSVDSDGNLVIHTALGSLSDQHPTTYQWIDGKRVEISSRFALNRRSRTAYGFSVGAYDRNQPLVVDPGLVYSTFLGGSADDAGNGIAVDCAGQAYVTGNTYSVNFPVTAGAFDTSWNGGAFTFGGGDTFVTKLNSNGSALVYSTFLGGTLDEPIFGSSIAVDSAGYAYVTGTTDSPDFPTTPGAFQTVLKGVEDAFVTKLNRNGSGLVYSTYLGGTGQDDTNFYNSIAVDSGGHAYVTGFTDSLDYPTTPGAFQTVNKGGFYDAFVTKLNTRGTGLEYSTYLGGSGQDGTQGIAVDAAGRAYVTGYTDSPDFPVKNAAQPTLGGSTDAFVTKLNSSGTALVYSTYLGGTADDAGLSIAVDSGGRAYVSGGTNSPNFPTTANALQPVAQGSFDGFVTKLSASGSAFVYSTYLGGTLDDQANGIAVDSAGQAHITGWTTSPDFPVTADAFQPVNAGGAGTYDAFVTKLNTSGSAEVYSTYLGGLVDDIGNGIALGRSGTVYVTGSTDSATFPVTPGAVQTTYAGGTYYGDAFVTKLDVPDGGNNCHKASGDGDAEEHDSGKKEHHHFHKKSSCEDPDDNENDNVKSDDDRGSHFQSTSSTSSTYTIKDNSQAITIVGTGLHNGLPVTFTMIAINFGDVAPGVFNLTLSDGYTYIGSIVNGTLDIQ